MKTNKSKKLNKQINTICDFNKSCSISAGNDTGSDTTATMTIITTTINTDQGVPKLTA